MKNCLYLQKDYVSSPNIALIKYWGKYNQDHILPLNDSLGITLNYQDIGTTTTIKFYNLSQNKLILNGEQHIISNRIIKLLRKVKEIAWERKYQYIQKYQWEQYHFEINSRNSFPTASGLASSASGLACLAAALNGLFQDVFKDNQISELARKGSGSASRSIYGGLVIWKGIPNNFLQIKQPTQQQLNELNKHCISQCILTENQLKYLKIIILLANSQKKQVSSTQGMKKSVETSQLIKYRNQIVKNRISTIINNFIKISQIKSQEQQSILFNQITKIIIKDSNQFHAICLDTYPPIFYLNQFSKQIMNIIDHILNPQLKWNIGYTFDAGPHAFLFVHEQALSIVVSYFRSLFNLKEESMNLKAKTIEIVNFQQLKFKKYKHSIIQPYAMWVTSVGTGAKQRFKNQ